MADDIPFGSDEEWVQGAFILSNGGRKRDPGERKRLARAECVLAARIVAMDSAPAPALSEQAAVEQALAELRDAFAAFVRREG